MPRYDPELGVPLDVELVTAALVPNTDPANLATIDTWDCTLAGAPIAGDMAKLAIGTTHYAYVVAAAVQDKWEIDVGLAPTPAGGDTTTLTIPGGAGSPYNYIALSWQTETQSGTGITVAGNNGDKAILTLNGVVYPAEKSPASTGTTMATELTDAALSGTKNKWSWTVGGGPAAGTETITITIVGDTGGNIGTGVWTYSPAGGRTDAQMAGDIKTLMATTFPSSKYDVGGGGTSLSATSKTRGVTADPSVDLSAAGAITMNGTHSVVGVAGQTEWVVSNVNEVVTVAHATHGVTADTCVASVTGTTVFDCVQTIAGQDEDDPTAIAAGTAAAAAGNGLYAVTALNNVVSLDQNVPGTGAAVTSSITGASSFVATNTQVGAPITPNGTLATAIAAAITADTLNCGYTAGAIGGAITVTANAAGAPTKGVSSQYNPPSGGTGTFLAVNTLPGQDASIPATAGVTMFGVKASAGTVVALLNAGVSYDLDLWSYDPATGWLMDLTFGTKTINASGIYTFTPSGIQMYAHVSNFIGGGASATVTLRTPS